MKIIVSFLMVAIYTGQCISMLPSDEETHIQMLLTLPVSSAEKETAHSPAVTSLALEDRMLTRSVSPERVRTPMLTPEQTVVESRWNKHLTHDQTRLFGERFITFEQRVLQILIHAQDCSGKLEYEAVRKTLEALIQVEKAHIEFLETKPSSEALAAFILHEPLETALNTWKKRNLPPLDVDPKSLELKIREAKDEIVATKVALIMSRQPLP